MKKSQMILPTLALTTALLFNSCDPQIEYVDREIEKVVEVEVPCTDPTHGNGCTHPETDCYGLVDCTQKLFNGYARLYSVSRGTCYRENCELENSEHLVNVRDVYGDSIKNGEWNSRNGDVHRMSNSDFSKYNNAGVFVSGFNALMVPCTTKAERLSAYQAGINQIKLNHPEADVDANEAYVEGLYGPVEL